MQGRRSSATRWSPAMDLSHKVILYLEDISVSSDGFKALNQ